MAEKAVPPRDVYRAVTESLIAAIEAGAGPFRLPWHKGAVARGFPKNAATGNRYRGVNVIALWAAAATRGFNSGVWATYRQWHSVGGQVRRGERGTTIVFYKVLDKADGDEAAAADRAAPRGLVARASRVFNADQVDGYEVPVPPTVDPIEAIDRIESFVAATGAVVEHGGDEAYYSLVMDRIQMPERSAFLGTTTSTPTEAYYATLLHELVHWSGAASRLARVFPGRFEPRLYAMEELVAEIGAAFLCAEFAVSPTPRPDHAAYLAEWLSVMKADTKALFVAAGKATEAVDYLIVRVTPEQRRQSFSSSIKE